MDDYGGGQSTPIKGQMLGKKTKNPTKDIKPKQYSKIGE